jgi:hypothetical protein
MGIQLCPEANLLAAVERPQGTPTTSARSSKAGLWQVSRPASSTILARCSDPGGGSGIGRVAMIDFVRWAVTLRRTTKSSTRLFSTPHKYSIESVSIRVR